MLIKTPLDTDIDYSSFPELRRAFNESAAKKAELNESLTVQTKSVPADAALVVFGSLARNEWSSGSDLDWTLLIDGQANPDHFDLAVDIKIQLSKNKLAKEPGATGTFGNVTFSHDLIHIIGGDEDTNKNTTKRILMLLESAALAGGQDVHDRVLRAIIERYVHQEANLLSRNGATKVPRFLLNDTVRFWRTMAVDFARKERENFSTGEKWGIRNAKLQLSRKLIFVSGLLMSFTPHLFLEKPAAGELRPSYEARLIQFLFSYAKATPLAILSFVSKELQEDVNPLLAPYDKFMAILNDEAKRKHLEETVTQKNSREDPIFCEVKALGDEFDKALQHLFFDNSHLRPLTRKYGLF